LESEPLAAVDGALTDGGGAACEYEAVDPIDLDFNVSRR
jgi:hypothetical protein